MTCACPECEVALDHSATPVGFVEEVLNLPKDGGRLYPWQDKAIAPLEEAGYGKPIVMITALTPNEGGKSSILVAGSSCWWVTTHPKGTVAITTKDSKQLNEQIIPAIEEQVVKFYGWHSVKSPYYKVTTPTGGRIVAYTTDDAGRVEGFHGKPDAPLLYIVDEAKSVNEKIFEGVDRCGYQALIYCSTGGLEVGTFYESHYGAISGRFKKIRAGLIDCPHISKEKVDRMIAKYGIDHPLVRSSVFGEFMKQGDTDEYCISVAALQNCLNSPPKHKPGTKRGFVDFGKGTAEHVFAVRDGNKIDIAAAWIESNPDATAGRLIREFRSAGFTPDTATNITCDASDKEIWQKLANAGWTIRRQNFGAPSSLKDEYKSWGAQVWIEGGLKIASNAVILPDDDVLKAQLINRKKAYTNTGKLAVEDKLEMQERGVASPDRADAVLGVMSLAQDYTQPTERLDWSSWREAAETQINSDLLTSIGANPGF